VGDEGTDAVESLRERTVLAVTKPEVDSQLAGGANVVHYVPGAVDLLRGNKIDRGDVRGGRSSQHEGGKTEAAHRLRGPLLREPSIESEDAAGGIHLRVVEAAEAEIASNLDGVAALDHGEVGEQV